MGIFSRRRPIERQLEEEYTKFIMQFGWPQTSARKTAKDLLAIAKRECSSDPDLPPNYGDVLLQQEGSDPTVNVLLVAKRHEGVTDTDIKWWWTLDKLERRLLIAVDDWFRLAAFSKYRSSGLSGEEAAKKLRQSFPVFGDPTNLDNAAGDDRPLPYELKDRINKWASRRGITQLGAEVDHATSMNALIRSDIRAGRL